MTTQQFDTKDLATMQADIRHIREMVDTINQKVDLLNGRVRETERYAERSETRWESHKLTHDRINEDIDGLDGDVKKWSLSIGGIIALITAFVTYITGR